MGSVTDDRIERLRSEVTRRRDDLRTPKQRQAIALEMAQQFRVHEDFILGFIEDVIGVVRRPSPEELERSERITHREIPQRDDD